MSPANKSKTESAHQWCVINPNFPLTESENTIINRHDAIWREHCAGGKPVDGHALELEWRSIINGSSDGDVEALKQLQTFGSLENFTRYRRAEQTGRRVKFDRENCGTFVAVHPIAKRLREIFEKLLKEYREGGEHERRLLGLNPVLNDDATSLMERTIAGLFAVESHTPAAFEVMANHVQLIEIEEDAQ
jgi:hypothetical protein